MDIKIKHLQHVGIPVTEINKARLFYEKLGFQVIREEDVAIGPYWMNDFVMSKALVAPEIE